MNLAITQAMTAPVKVAGQTAAAGTGAGSKDAGFAGALVQALGGSNAQQPNAGGTVLPVAFTSLVMQGGDASSDAAGDAVLSLLDGLIKQLQQQPGQDDKDSSASANDVWAQLLAGLQSLLQQLLVGAQPQDDSLGTQPDAADGTSAASTLEALPAAFASALTLLTPALQTALQQLQPGARQTDGAAAQPQAAAAATNGPAGSSVATALLPLLPALQTALQQLSSAPDVPVGVADAFGALLERLNAAELAPTAASQAGDGGAAAAAQQVLRTEAADSLQVAAAASQQPAAVFRTESRPAAQAFKEPLVHWQLTPAAEGSASEPAPVPAASADQAAGDQTASLPWAMQASHQQPGAAAQAQTAPPAPVPVQQFAQQVGSYLVRQFVLSGGNGTAEARLTLHPEHLGQVDVRIVMHDGQMTAQFVTHSTSAKELLENQMAMLRTALQNQGIDVQRMDVVQQSGLTDSAAFDSQQQRHSDPNRGGEAGRRDRDGLYDDQANFEAELERTNALREAGYGSSLDVTA